MRHFLIPIIFSLLPFSLTAQKYNTSAGVRFGTDWGITAKQRVYENITGEFIIQSGLFRDEVMLTLLGAYHQRIAGRRFNLYFGGGLHKGWLTQDVEGSDLKDPFGIDLIGGIEIVVAGIHFSYDIKPGFNLSGGESDIFLQSGISARYVFVKEERLPWEPDKRTQRQKRREKRRRQRGKN